MADKFGFVGEKQTEKKEFLWEILLKSILFVISLMKIFLYIA